MTTVARAIDAAARNGAEVINISSGFPCKPILGLNLCDDGVRTAVEIICFAIGGLIRSVVPLAGEVINSVGCTGVITILHLGGVADEDALAAAVAAASAQGIVIVASGPESITLPVAGDLGPFRANEVGMEPCILPGVICTGWMHRNPAEATTRPHRQPRWRRDRYLGSGKRNSHDVDAGCRRRGDRDVQRDERRGALRERSRRPHESGRSILAPPQILSILEGTSNLFDTDPTSPRTPHPLTPSRSVGYVDAFAAVVAASGVTLPCDGWDEDGAPPNDDFASATNLGMLPGAIGAELSVSGSIHALPRDEDWYRFTASSVNGAPSAVVEITLAVPDPRFGHLEFELYRAGAGRENRIARGFNSRIDRVLLFAGTQYHVRVLAEDPAGINDNCYDALVIRVLEPGPSADRYETNDGRSRAALVLEDWVKIEDHDPTIFEHEAVVPVTPGVPGWTSDDRWELEIPDLSLHSPGIVTTCGSVFPIRPTRSMAATRMSIRSHRSNRSSNAAKRSAAAVRRRRATRFACMELSSSASIPKTVSRRIASRSSISRPSSIRAAATRSARERRAAPRRS